MVTQDPDAAEAALIADALADRLGIATIVLLHCVRPAVVVGLSRDRCVLGVDDPAAIGRMDAGMAHVSCLESTDETWPERLTSKLSGALLFVAADWLLARTAAADELARLLASARAAVVIDPDGHVALEAVGALNTTLAAAGLQVAHRSLVRAPRQLQRESPLFVVTGRHDPQVHDLLAAGTRGLRLDRQVDPDMAVDGPLRICVVSYEVSGPTRNGGIGTANTSLAHALARAGHEVTLLFTGNVDPNRTEEIAGWKGTHARHGATFEVLGAPMAPGPGAPHYNVRRAYEVYQYLRAADSRAPFDVVHFPECQGHGYYATLAKRLGQAFQRTLLVAGVHSSTRWCAEANRELMSTLDALVDDQLERRSVELADVVISPSAYMLDYLTERGWRLPKRRFVQPYVLPPTNRPRAGRVPDRPRNAPNELVFFGRLEVRKGIETFCDALDVLGEDTPDDLRVTFVGRPEHVAGEPAVDYVARRAARWPWPCELKGELNRGEAMSYLRSHHCIAVMPSTVDNSPNTVSETLSLGIPFITSRSGGTGELMDPLDVARCTFPGLEANGHLPPLSAGVASPPPDAHALADRVRAALENPGPPADFAVDHAANERAHTDWHATAVAAMRAAADAAPGPAASPPSITVGVVHRDDGRGLDLTLESLAGQEGVTDVVVVDDASTGDDCRAALARARGQAEREGWVFVRRTTRHSARAYATVVQRGHGELLIMLSAGQRLFPGTVRRLGELAAADVADIVSWVAVDGEGATAAVPLDGPALAGLLYPAFCAGGFAITRGALSSLGGFAHDATGDDAIQDLLNRALLQGLRLTVSPEPLAMLATPDRYSELRRSMTTEVALPEEDRERQVRITRPYRHADLPDLPGLYLLLVRTTTAERLQGQAPHHGHHQAEYIAYLEHEHHVLSDRIHALEARSAVQRSQRLRRVLGRLMARPRS